MTVAGSWVEVKSVRQSPGSKSSGGSPVAIMPSRPGFSFRSVAVGVSSLESELSIELTHGTTTRPITTITTSRAPVASQRLRFWRRRRTSRRDFSRSVSASTEVCGASSDTVKGSSGVVSAGPSTFSSGGCVIVARLSFWWLLVGCWCYVVVRPIVPWFRGVSAPQAGGRFRCPGNPP